MSAKAETEGLPFCGVCRLEMTLAGAASPGVITRPSDAGAGELTGGARATAGGVGAAAGIERAAGGEAGGLAGASSSDPIPAKASLFVPGAGAAGVEAIWLGGGAAPLLAALWRPSGGIRGTIESGGADCGVSGADRGAAGGVSNASAVLGPFGDALAAAGAAGGDAIAEFEVEGLAACGLVGTAGMSADSLQGLTLLADPPEGALGVAGVTGAAGCLGDLAGTGESRSPNWLS